MKSTYNAITIISCILLFVSSVFFFVLPSTWFLSLLQAISIINSICLLIYQVIRVFNLGTKYAKYYRTVIGTRDDENPQIVQDPAIFLDGLEAKQTEQSETENAPPVFGIRWNIISFGIIFFSNAILVLLICITSQPTKRATYILGWPAATVAFHFFAALPLVALLPLLLWIQFNEFIVILAAIAASYYGWDYKP